MNTKKMENIYLSSYNIIIYLSDIEQMYICVDQYT